MIAKYAWEWTQAARSAQHLEQRAKRLFLCIFVPIYSMMVMMTLLKLFCMPKHPWNKELSIYTATQRKTSSTTADIAHVTTAVQSMTSSKFVCLPPCEFDICLGCVLQMPIAWWRCRTRRARLRLISLPTSRSTQARAQFFRKESRLAECQWISWVVKKIMPAVHTSRARPLHHR